MTCRLLCVLARKTIVLLCVTTGVYGFYSMFVVVDILSLLISMCGMVLRLPFGGAELVFIELSDSFIYRYLTVSVHLIGCVIPVAGCI